MHDLTIILRWAAVFIALLAISFKLSAIHDTLRNIHDLLFKMENKYARKVTASEVEYFWET